MVNRPLGVAGVIIVRSEPRAGGSWGAVCTVPNRTEHPVQMVKLHATPDAVKPTQTANPLFHPVVISRSGQTTGLPVSSGSGQDPAHCQDTPLMPTSSTASTRPKTALLLKMHISLFTLPPCCCCKKRMIPPSNGRNAMCPA